jgi:ABC-type uncharacterized transport system ATPase subunit
MRKGELALEGKISNLLAGGGYRVTASAVPEQALAEIRRLGASMLPAAEGIAIQVRTRDEANAVIDKVRAAGGFIESVSASTSSLEDVFIQATQHATQAERAA